MLTTQTQNSKTLHRLARFVTKQAAALMFDLDEAEIYSVECWANIVYVHGKGLSRFVSYADFPPTVEVEPPSEKDFSFWRRRWKKRPSEQKRQAPTFWVPFFAHQFQQARSLPSLYSWGKLIALVKFAFTETTLEQLRQSYRYAQTFCRQVGRKNCAEKGAFEKSVDAIAHS